MKKKILFLLFLCLPLFLSGCWSKRELNELAITVAIGIDKVDDQYEVSVQIVDPGEVSARNPSANRTSVNVYHAKGKSIFEAIRRMTTVTPRKLYFAHIQILILGEDLAKEGISDALELFVRDHEIRNDFYIIVSEETTAKEILEIITPLEKIPANKMFNSLDVSESTWATTSTVQLDELANQLSKKEKNTILSAITIKGDPKQGIEQSNVQKIDAPAKLQYSGLAVFKQDKLVGSLSEDESKGYNFLKNKVKSTVEIISCPNGGQLTTELFSAKTKVKGKIKNGSPSIDVSVTVNQNVGVVECNIDLTKKETIDLINKETSESIKEKIHQTLEILQKDYKADVLEFGEAIHRTDHKEWNKIKNDWVQLFPELKINVSVDVKTRGLGTMQNSIIHNSKE
ncbi:Ger(x)C family spore germination protein [Psychrobacillus vulpis]|uniref:Ger(X)C family spore germination protein n=1 Tax=Psychrobacillus vulpis TaxID=2325572 RepID=A0A544TNG9_9BACI|nr:Ger(x)C family spore germination protein [Psychrobacillus vulpis]TQR19006.1 Ger(x)C family spore germination protein [Psychrobacillus vulpis]